jgi:hypothetical protein
MTVQFQELGQAVGEIPVVIDDQDLHGIILSFPVRQLRRAAATG